jgi:hypothetical protein
MTLSRISLPSVGNVIGKSIQNGFESPELMPIGDLQLLYFTEGARQAIA